MRRAVLLVLFTSAWGLAEDKKPEAGKGDNLLVNGSFEEGPELEMWLSLNKDSTAVKGWTVTRDQVDLVGSHWKAADGKRSLDLHGSPGYGGIQQAFKTEKGKAYKVTFSLSGTPKLIAGHEGVKSLSVKAAGKKKEFNFDTAEATADDMKWVTKTWEFTATGDETTLEFHTLETTHPNCGPVIDDVRVVPVKPEAK